MADAQEGRKWQEADSVETAKNPITLEHARTRLDVSC